MRPCRLDDLGDLLRIEKVAFPDDAYSKAVFLFYLMTERDGFIVALKGDSVVGYVIATNHGGQGLIQSIAVSPEFRRRGIGAKLMQAAIARLAVKFNRVFLQVDAKQESTIRFYRALSFRETGKVLKRYYRNGDDGMEMMREI